MAAGQGTAILRHIGKLVAEQKICRASDRELLLRFTNAGDEAAFAAILQRHGTMVLRVCRRLLADPQDADDAFQAVFLVLLRRASLLRWRDSVGGWLHQVAYRVAQHMRKQHLRRRVHEARAAARSVEAAGDDVSVREAQAILHEELHRLPERLRAPLVLCYLESATQDEAARRLGWSLRTLKRRLERGRAVLHARLVRRGFMLATVLSTSLLTDGAVSATITRPTMAAPVSFLAGQASVSPAVSAAVAATLRGMFLAKLRVTSLMIFAVLLGTGVGLVGSFTNTIALSHPEHESVETSSQTTAPERLEEKTAGRDRYGDPLPPSALARLGTVRFRQQSPATGLAFSRDGKLLAGYCPLLGVVLWQSATGRQVRLIEVKQYTARRPFDFPPDGKTLATVDRSGDISLWELTSGKKLRTVPYSGGRFHPTDIRFSPDGKVIACISYPQNKVALLDAVTGKLLHIVGGRPAAVYKAVFSPDGKHVLLATHTPCLELWDVATGKLLRSMADRPDNSAHDAVFSPDGKLIAASVWDEVAVFDSRTAKEVFRLPRKFKTILSGHGLAFTSDSKKLLFHGDGKFWIFDLAGKTLHAGFDAAGEHPALSPDGTTVALSSSSRIRVWDVPTGKELFCAFEGHTAPVAGLFLSPDKRTLFTVAEDRQVRIWDTATGQETGRLKPNGRAAGLSPDGNRLVLLRNNKKSAIGVWDLAERSEVLTLQPTDLTSKGDYVVERTQYTSDAANLISLEHRRPPEGTEWGDSRLIIWDAATGRPGHRILLRSVDPGALALAPDARTAFLIKNDGSARYYSGAILCIDLKQGRVFRSLKASTYDLIPEGLALSPDGKLLASASYDHNVRLWETNSGQEVFTLAGRQPAVAVAFSPDGRILAAAGSVLGFATSPKGLQTIRLWDTVTGQELGRFQGHDADVNALVFSLDGKKLFSAQKDSTVLIWDMTLIRPAPLKLTNFTQADLANLWADLGAGNARRAHEASWKLVANPGQAVSFLKAKVKPAGPADPAHVRRLIADLDSQQFQVRDAARRALELLDRQVEQPLRQALAGTTSLELRRRLEKALDKSTLAPDVLRDLRAVTTLERIGSRNARAVLEALGKGAPDARLTEAAKTALKRLTRKKA